MSARWGSNGIAYKNQPVYDAIKFYGWDNIEHKIIQDNLTYAEAQELEKEMIFLFDSIEHGYNVNSGGGLGGNPWVIFEYKGEFYSPDELAELSPYELTGHDMTTRIRHHGWDIEKALNTPKQERNQKFEYNGEFYTINELYELRPNRSLTKSQIKNRLMKHGWDAERALTQGNNTKKQSKGVGTCLFEYEGKLYNSYELTQLSPLENLTPVDITTRINKHGWSVERAITQPKRSR